MPVIRAFAPSTVPSTGRVGSVLGAALLTAAFLAPTLPAGAAPAAVGDVVTLEPESFLERLAQITDADGRLPRGTRLELAPGQYDLQTRAYADSTCGNCEDPHTLVMATVGWRVSGSGIVITATAASDADSVLLFTHAGYGLLFENCDDCRIEGVTVTGGTRDPDGRATDAAIVVKNSTVRIDACRIRDNIGDVRIVQEQIVGIIGIAGREGAHIEIRRNRIRRNSWDGIALYRGAQATIEDNVVDGIDKARGKQIGGGRGVGIGLTWDARAVVRRNRVTRYWKGIGIFVDARAEVSQNVVEEILTWGIAYWDAGKGKPVARIEENLVFDTGACGISLARDGAAEAGDPEPGSCRRNLVVRSGQNPRYDSPDDYCAQQPIAIENLPPGFDVSDNFLFQNRRAPSTDRDEDLDAAAFLQRSHALWDTLSTRPALAGSRGLATLQAMMSQQE